MKRYSEREMLLGVCSILIVTGSQIGMTYLATLYSIKGRLDSTLTLELIFGIIAILVFTLYILKNGWKAGGSLPLVFLLMFVIFAAIAEVINWISSNGSLRVSTFTLLISIYIYTLIGYEYGRMVMRERKRLIFANALIYIYLVWYVALLILYALGYLGFNDVLAGSGAKRLAFISGYTATEIPLYIGLHAPVLIYFFLMKGNSKIVKMLSAPLFLAGFIVTALTLSAAALAAFFLMSVVFYWAYKGLSSSRALNFAIFIIGVLFLLKISLSDSEIVRSVFFKIEGFIWGDSARSRMYEHLLKIIYESPLGIGRGEFALINNYSWGGKGVYPHHNLLGIGAELGWGALISYTLFIFTTIYVLGKSLVVNSITGRPREIRLLIAVGFSIFLFQQFRGNFHDTWPVKELYFWVGMSLSVASKRYLINRVDVSSIRAKTNLSGRVSSV